ncbi:AraC family transcriptional regulator [Sinomicrobium pectinilyticum]|nr:AraC family transcriptional regulator [Sinomicrobium pectinilyticum]
MKAKKIKDTLNWLKGYKYHLYSLERINYTDSIIQLLSTTTNEKLLYELSVPYYIKAERYYEKREYDAALTNYLKSKELSDDMDVNFNIAIIKARFGHYKEALKMYKKAEQFYNNDNTFSDYLITLFAMGDAYRHLEQLDSASYYNNLGYKESREKNTKKLLPYFILNEAATDYDKGNFQKSYDSIQKILPDFINSKDVSNLVSCYYFLGMAAQHLDYKNESISALKKVDSLTLLLNDLEPEYRKGYEILIKHFQLKEDPYGELKYVKRLLAIDSVLNTKYQVLSKRLVKEYDTPLLLEEKEQLISSLRNEKKNFSTYLFISGGVILLITIYVIWSYRKQRQYKKRLEAVLQREQRKPQQIPLSKQDDLDIRPEIIKDINSKLYAFEKNKEFIKSEISIQSLAANFNTNTRYLSKIINFYKDKNFSNYINDLRINYCIERLKSDKQFRKYTIKAIAQECGFNTSESFSNAFLKNTEIKPSFFIKNMENVNRNS